MGVTVDWTCPKPIQHTRTRTTLTVGCATVQPGKNVVPSYVADNPSTRTASPSLAALSHQILATFDQASRRRPHMDAHPLRAAFKHRSPSTHFRPSLRSLPPQRWLFTLAPDQDLGCVRQAKRRPRFHWSVLGHPVCSICCVGS